MMLCYVMFLVLPMGRGLLMHPCFRLRMGVQRTRDIGERCSVFNGGSQAARAGKPSKQASLRSVLLVLRQGQSPKPHQGSKPERPRLPKSRLGSREPDPCLKWRGDAYQSLKSKPVMCQTGSVKSLQKKNLAGYRRNRKFMNAKCPPIDQIPHGLTHTV